MRIEEHRLPPDNQQLAADAAQVRGLAGAWPACNDRGEQAGDRKSTRLNSSHTVISYAVFCLKKKNLPHRKGRAPALSMPLERRNMELTDASANPTKLPLKA